MEPDEAAYQHAKANFEQQPWRLFAGHQGWDGYWFESDARLELFNMPSGRPSRELDLQSTGAAAVNVNFVERVSQQTVLRGDRRACTVKLGKQASVLRVISHADIKQLGLTIEQVDGSARIQLGAATAEVPRIDIEAPASRQIELSGVDSSIIKSRGNSDEIVAINAGVGLGTVPVHTLRLVGKCRAISSTRGPVGRLLVDADASITGGREQGDAVVQCMSIEIAPGADTNSVFRVGSKCEVVIEKAENLSVSVALGATFSVFVGTNLRIFGEGKVNVVTSVDGVSFVDGRLLAGFRSDPPQLEMQPWAVVRRASGVARLGDVRHAEISGTPKGDGLTVHSIVRQAEGVGSPTEGLLIRDFQVPVAMAGLQTIRMLAETAAVAVPIIHAGLPGKRGEPARDVTPHFRSDYARAMAQLGESGGAQGSVVTKLAQLEYRMRRKTAKGPIEKATLWAYSSIGYGERAVPALVTYFALALIFSAIALYGAGHMDLDPSWADTKRFGKSLVDWLITPLHVLRLGSQESQAATGNDWEFLGRVLLAIPFVTGVLALRKYVKRTHERG